MHAAGGGGCPGLCNSPALHTPWEGSGRVAAIGWDPPLGPPLVPDTSGALAAHTCPPGAAPCRRHRRQRRRLARPRPLAAPAASPPPAVTAPPAAAAAPLAAARHLTWETGVARRRCRQARQRVPRRRCRTSGLPTWAAQGPARRSPGPGRGRARPWVSRYEPRPRLARGCRRRRRRRQQHSDRCRQHPRQTETRHPRRGRSPGPRGAAAPCRWRGRLRGGAGTAGGLASAKGLGAQQMVPASTAASQAGGQAGDRTHAPGGA